MESNLNDKFLTNIETTYETALELLYAKNADYATDSDPFQNFREAAKFAGVTIEQGISIRLGDKISRYKNLLKNRRDPKVTTESLTDTFLDIINYFAILKAWYDLGEPDADTNYFAILNRNVVSGDSSVTVAADAVPVAEEVDEPRRGWFKKWLDTPQS